MRSLLLIRHAEPQLRGVFLGQLDSPLSPSGHERARTDLARISVEIVYCSPLRRACETAQYIRARETRTIHALREIDYGAWTGLSWSEIERQHQELASAKILHWLAIAPPAGEHWDEVLKRVQSVCPQIRSGPEPAAVVAHQAVNAALAYLLAQRDPLQFRQAYGEVIRVEFD